MGGRMAEFFITDGRRSILIAHFARKHGADSAEFFVTTCEREIVAWLKRWPPIQPVANDAVAQLEQVRRLSVDLHSALFGLDDRAAWLLGGYIIEQCEGEGARRDWTKVRKMLGEVMDFVRMISEDAGHCHEWTDGPITRRSDQDLCGAFVRTYQLAFHELPPSTPGSLFPAFCEEIASDIEKHPEAPEVRITRTVIEKALQRQASWPTL